MATLQTVTCSLLSWTLAITFFSLTTIGTTTAIGITTMVSNAKPKRLVTRLIHHDSISNNSNNSIAYRSERALNSSIARLIYLSQKDFETHEFNIIPGTNSIPLFYVNFSIGQPPITQLAIMDTGSDLVWVLCHPCTNCSQQQGPIFDPWVSSTYTSLPCGYSFCDDCSPSHECMYSIAYVKGTASEGKLAIEKFTFETSDEGMTSVDNVVFGCSHKNEELRDRELKGMFGLAINTRHPSISLVNHLGSRFSYCIGDITDPQYKHNKLILGVGTILGGYSTPLELLGGFYYITLEGISVGEKRLDIDPNVFKRTNKNNGVIIDSGATYSWLALHAYESLRKEIEEIFQGLLKRSDSNSNREWHLCYSGTIDRDLYGFPTVTLHFADGAELVLDNKSLFFQFQYNIFCMAIGPSDHVLRDEQNNQSTIGVLAQQNYNVAYDLIGERLYFQRIDCELLADD